MSNKSAEHDNHGSTPAAWTAVVIGLLGFAVGTYGVVISAPVLFWVGVAMQPVALIAGKVLSLLGFGAQK